MESKIKPNLLLIVVKYGLDVVWYLSLVLIIVTVVLVAKRSNNPPSGNRWSSISVDYTGKLSESYTPMHENVTSVEFQPTHGRLVMTGGKFRYKKLLWFGVFSLITYFVFVFYLRKIFTSFLHQSPFCMENVKRIRILAYCFVVVNILVLACKRHIIPDTIAEYSNFPTLISYSFPGDYKYIAIAIVIYILADIFKYGFQIQEENNKFI